MLGNAVWLSVDGTITTTDALTVRYVVPTGSGAAPVKDSAGNNAPAIATRAVRNDRIQLVITDPGPDKTYILGRGFGGQDSIEVTVTFSDPVIVSEVPEITLEVGGEARRASYHSGSGTKSLVFQYEVMEGETDSEGIWVRSSGEISKLRGPGVVRYASTKAVVPARLWSSIRTDFLVDTVRPTLVRANALANGNDVDLRWDKALDETSAPTATGTTFFKVKDTSDDSSHQITAISVLGKVVTLTLSTAIAATDRLTVSYEDLFRGSDVSFDNHEPLKDTLGNHARKDSAAVSITRSANRPAEFPSSETGTRSVGENTLAGRNIGVPITASDADGDRRTYSISGTDAAFFEVVARSGQLLTSAALDHESRDSYSFTMAVHDGKDVHGNADTATDDTISVTVTVNDVDEAPGVSGSNTVDFEEGGIGIVATYTSTDPDREGIDIVLTGADSDDFTLSGGILSFNEVPDFEEPADSNRDNRYGVTVEAREQGDGASVGRLNVTILVTNVDEPGVLVTNVAEPRVGQSVRLNVEDEDGGESVTEWKWERGEPNSPCGTVDNPTIATWETISSARSSSYTPTLADRGHCIMATAFYNDRAGTGRTEQFLTPNSVEVGPFFTQDPPTFNVPENTAEGVNVGRAQARHSNSGETLTYRLGGADAGYFTIDDNAQLKTSATPLDYETQPGMEAVVEITAGDNSGETSAIGVTVAVTDDCASAGEPPCAPGRPSVSSMSTSSLKISWSTPATPSSTSITGYELQFRESDNAGSWIREFATGTDRSHTIENLIEGTAYEVRVSASNDSSGYGEWSESGTGTPGSTSRTTRTTRTTTETSTGGGGGGFAAFAPVNSAPSFIGGTRANRTVPENAEPGTLIGNPVTAEDTDGDELTYTLHGDDADFFTVLAGTGQLRVKAALDFEARTSYSLQVQVDDGKGGVDTVQVTVVRHGRERGSRGHWPRDAGLRGERSRRRGFIRGQRPQRGAT